MGSQSFKTRKNLYACVSPFFCFVVTLFLSTYSSNSTSVLLFVGWDCVRFSTQNCANKDCDICCVVHTKKVGFLFSLHVQVRSPSPLERYYVVHSAAATAPLKRQTILPDEESWRQVGKKRVRPGTRGAQGRGRKMRGGRRICQKDCPHHHSNSHALNPTQHKRRTKNMEGKGKHKYA